MLDHNKEEDNCKRNPVQLDRVPHYITQSLLVLQRSNKITNFEFFITYCYLFNGISLKMLRDRILRKTDQGYEFASKQHIHQNIITKVINLMKKEMEKIKEAERTTKNDT